MSTPKATKGGQKELDLTGAFDWDNGDALTHLIRSPTATPPPPLAPAREPITAFLLPQQLSAAMPSLPAPPGAATTSTATAKPPVSLVRVASYGLVLLLAAGVGLKALQVSHAKAPRNAASSALVARSANVPSNRAQPRARAVIETRPLDVPSVKAAATAFARGDYREALAHYRLLARQNPRQQAFQSLVTILERRLAPKAAQP